jgi:polysaccharide export outer membrane protein
MKTVMCLAVGAVSVLCLAAQTPPANSGQPDQQKNDTSKSTGRATGTKPSDDPQSLPPGPLGLAPMLDTTKPDSGAKTDGATKPPADAADPNKMAAPAGGGKVTSPVDGKAYIIGAEDVLRIYTWNQANLSGEFVVRPDGKISIPLVGDVQAADRTPEQLGKDIEQKLKDGKILLDPNVNVQIFQVHSKKFFIEGEVNRPGDYDLVVPTTIMEGLVHAGGFKDFANRKKIVILRDGGKTVLRFNYEEVSKGKRLDQNTLLQPGDHIIIR